MHNMKTEKLKIFIIGLSALILSGCASKNATYIESGGSRSIVSTNKINMADWNAASAALVNELVASGAIDATGLQQPIKMKVSQIVNRTSTPVDTDLLTRQICIALTNTGKISAVSGDPQTSELAQYEAKRQGKTIGLPKLTMTGKIVEDRESNSDMKEVTYVFFLEVNYLGKAIWMGQKQIAKQQERGGIGW